MTTTDMAALCAVIDAGDDSALPILADLLEETGDPRAAGLRRLGRLRRKATPYRVAETRSSDAGCWGWGPTSHPDAVRHGYAVPIRVFRRLTTSLGWGSRTYRAHSSRSAAYLALAAALA